MEILRLKQSCFRIKLSEKLIYTDPYQIPENSEHKSKADIILISHPHFDHYHIPSIKHISNKQTLIIAPRSAKAAHKLSSISVILNPNESYDFEGIKITAFPAYNLNKFFHRKKKNWVGYLITDGKTRFYHAGDTDLIPEMENLSTLNIDYAFIPISGKFVMDLNEAVDAVKIIRPKNVIPMHELSSNPNIFENLIKNEIGNLDINVIKLKNNESYSF